MPPTSPEVLSLLLMEAMEALPSIQPAPGRALPASSESPAVFGSAARLLRQAEGERAAHRGPGWFDSSWDLSRGCEVCEGWPGDASLRGWIGSWLYGAAAGGGASLSAT
ncbi:MAG: hypothetical protein ABI330_10990 [Caldimonas sp.]